MLQKDTSNESGRASKRQIAKLKESLTEEKLTWPI